MSLDEMGQSATVAFEDGANEFALKMMQFICATRALDRVKYPEAPAFCKADFNRGVEHFRNMALYHLSHSDENDMALTEDNLDEFIEHIATRSARHEMYPPLLLDK